ncbi:uncharacterized protein LOC134291034 [Aedes albopictus]|uniref:Pro-Pol polyprotein n=1 Tax=Aedes albopictus TaxID=7160 RepID=A0ABM1Y2I0_AEDAL
MLSEPPVDAQCIACNRPNTAEPKMVQCDGCSRWYHFTCAGVGDSIEGEDRSYQCALCRPPSRSASSVRTTSTTASTREARLRLEMQRLEEEKKLREKANADRLRLEEEFLDRRFKLLQAQLEDEGRSSRASGVSGNKSTAASANVQRWIDNHQVSVAANTGNVVPTGATSQIGDIIAPAEPGVAVTTQCSSRTVPVTTVSSREVKSNREVAQAAVGSEPFDNIISPNTVAPAIPGGFSRPFDNVISPITTVHPARFNSVPSSVAPQSFQSTPLVRNISASMPGSKTTLPLPVNPSVPSAISQPVVVSASVGHLEPLPIPASNPYMGNGPNTVRYIAEDPSAGQYNPIAIPSSTMWGVSSQPQYLGPPLVSVSSYQTPISAVPNPDMYGGMQSSVGPNAQQLAARHVVPKDLPFFGGNPTEWPVFWSSYETSTQLCAYNDSENVMRLQRCLKGEARKAVCSLLLHPSNVPDIIKTLKVLYGRPEAIISNLLAEVRAAPTPRPEKLGSIITFGLAVRNLCAHLIATNQQVHLANPILMEELVEKLPANIKLDWALHKQRMVDVDLKTFSDYMDVIVTAASSVTPVIDKNEKTNGKAVVNSHLSEVHAVKVRDQKLPMKIEAPNQPGSQRPCMVCKTAEHKPKDCSAFKSKALEDKWKVAQEEHLCRRCLYPHGKWPCKAPVCGVGGCEQKHHRLLHPGDPRADNTTTSAPVSGVISVHQHHHRVLFRIIPVVLHANGRSVGTFAFLDSGSDATLVDRSLAEQLGVQGPTSPLCMQWTNGVKRVEEDSQQIQMNISGSVSGKQFSLRKVQTVGGLELPQQSVDFEELRARYPYLNGLPVESFRDAKPGILIGLDHTRLKTTLKLREGREHEPVAAKTRLGWVIYGRSGDAANTSSQHVLHIGTRKRDDDLHELVKSFFSMESVGVSIDQVKESAEDQRARDILQSTTRRTENGRFETGLLWKFDDVEFPNSKPMAERRLKCLENRLLKSPHLYTNVRQQIADYVSKGYAHKATGQEIAEMNPKRTWFLPLGIVVNPKKPDKVRVVWDAAASVQGVSLNSVLLKGPDLMTSLQTVLSRYRQREIAISGDIMEMFHQVLISRQDRSAQWFLWRDYPSESIQVYVMDVAIFGATCSPSSTQYVKNLNAGEYSAEFPRASEAIQDNHYVDDYLDSVDTIQEAVQLALEVKAVHEKAGFLIRHWMSNSPEVLQRIGEQNTKAVKSFTMDKGSNVERVLGMVWRPQEDMFVFSLTLREDLRHLIDGLIVPTKRQLLSLVMSVFDPLGLVAPFVVHGKTIVQDVWRSGIGWDEQLPAEIVPKWEQYISLLEKLDSVRIPRCYFPGYSLGAYESMQLHVFVDASSAAYAAVAYFRIVDNGVVRCSLVSAKTKVAPMKLLSIPRLELQAAVIGTRLMKSISSSHTLQITRKVMWSDSSTVLNWIRSDPRKYRQYVAFRVTEILDETEVTDWRKVPSRMNVADEATKWGNGPCFDQGSRWYKAPEFLYKPECDWPDEVIEQTTAEELKIVAMHQVVPAEQVIDFTRFSRWEKLTGTLAVVLRFGKRKTETRTNNPSSESRRYAESVMVRLIQMGRYAEEYRVLQRNQQVQAEERQLVDRSSCLFKLSPFLDPDGVIRMGSRIGYAECVPYEAKFPAILPKDHYVTHLVLNWFHRKYGHANNETIVNEVRQRFHVSELRTAVKKVARSCSWCKVYKSKPKVPPMAPLPDARITPYVRAFSFTGLDYFGPITVRFGRGSAKRWVALFSCLGTRAVHLEVAYSLSTESCKMAIRRFISRRGAPQEIYSDQGTNFQGANAELKMQMTTTNRHLAQTFTNANTQWKFNPPYAPHMGGILERLVRSVKAGLSNMALPKNPDEETLVTAIVEVESIVNSRPLTYLPIDSQESEALTPNHFLLLSSNGVVQPAVRPTEEGAALRTNWKHIQIMLDRFWTRWIREYLPVIARQPKWFGEVTPINVGDLVIVVNDGIRNSWTRGKILRVYPGRDGQSGLQTMN